MNELQIRRATPADAEVMIAHRRAMFYENGYRDNSALDAMIESFRPWLQARMQTNEYLAWVVIDGTRVVAGLARRLIELALEWCRSNGIRVVILHASDEGRPLYERLGFQPTNEMRLLLV